MPFFSVIIATFNRAHLIAQTLESVLAQDFSDFEMIVIDDGSTDDTAAVLAGFEKHIRIIRQNNEGLGAARNAGIAISTGAYVAFIDSDDLWFPWTLSTYKDVIERNNHPAWLAAPVVEFADPNEIAPLRREADHSEYFADYLASHAFAYNPPPSAAAVRSDVLKRVGGFFTHRLYCEDLDLWFRIGTATGFAKIHSPLCCARRLHDTNMVKNAPKIAEGCWYVVGEELGGRYPGEGRKKERIELLTRHVRPVSLQCVRSGIPGFGWKFYRTCFGWHVMLGRIKYLFAFPMVALANQFRGS